MSEAANRPMHGNKCPVDHSKMHQHAGVHGHAAAGCPASTGPATSGLAMMLRTGTQDLHERAEGHEFQRNFAAGNISREQYGLFLVQMLHVHGAMEPKLRSLSTTNAALGMLVTDNHFRYDLLRKDLIDLGVVEDSPVYTPTRRFAQFIEEAAKSDPVALVGVLYVKEGATNGNKIIVKQVRQSLGLTDGQASRYLDPHGAEQRPRWMAFRGTLDALPLTDDEKARVVAAARKTFEFFAEVSEDLVKLEAKGDGVPAVVVGHAAAPVTAH